MSSKAEEAKIIKANLTVSGKARKEEEEASKLSVVPPVSKTADGGDSGEESEEVDGDTEDMYQFMSVRVLSRFVVDYIVESAWNESRVARSHSMSFSAFRNSL